MLQTPAFAMRSNQANSYGNYKTRTHYPIDNGRLHTTSHGASHAVSWDSRMGWNFPGPNPSRAETHFNRQAALPHHSGLGSTLGGTKPLSTGL